MRTGCRLAGAAGWVLGLASAAVALQLSGQGALAAPSLTDPGQWAGWLGGRDPVVAAFALVRVAALAALWYLATVTVVGLLLRLGGGVRTVAVADRFTVAPVRRALAGTFSIGLAASGFVAVASPVVRLPVAAAAAQPAAPTPTAGLPGTVTMHQLSPAYPVPAPVPSAIPGVTPSAPRSSERWTVEPGQCFWSIAESVLATHLGRGPSEAEIVPYWRRLVEANRSELAHRDNPDLIFPGQVFEVPAP